jgi:hypothetical protein
MSEHEYKSVWTKLDMSVNPPLLTETFSAIRQHEADGWELVAIEPIAPTFFPGDRQILVVLRRPFPRSR